MCYKVLEPLTKEEQAFAEANHGVVDWYLSVRKLDPSEWYDVVIFRYLRSVKRYLSEPELSKYKFVTVACAAMRSAIGHEMEARKRREAVFGKPLSLDAVLDNTESLTLMEIVTNENNNYVYLRGGCSSCEISMLYATT